LARESPNPYEVLGVLQTASQSEITHAYRAKLRAHHPDTRQPSDSEAADGDLRRVVAAYARLRDSTKRADDDRDRVTAQPAPSPVGVVQIPVTYRSVDTPTSRVPSPPLRAGPVRRHR
jgi:hypothetical protein